MVIALLGPYMPWLRERAAQYVPTRTPRYTRRMAAAFLSGFFMWRLYQKYKEMYPKKIATSSVPIPTMTNVVINQGSTIRNIMIVVTHWKHVFDTPSSVEGTFYADPNDQCAYHQMYPSYDCKTRFNDTERGVEEYIVCQKHERKSDGDVIESPKLMICVSGKMTAVEYVRIIVAEAVKILDSKRKRSLYMYRFGPAQASCRSSHKIIDVSGSNATDRKKDYIDTFVSPHIDRIWNSIKYVQHGSTVGESAAVSYLFYGPPGTGKSSIARRIACATGRHLVVINLSEYVDFANQLEALISMTRLQDHNNHILRPRDVIFMFDEMDDAVEKIVKHEEAERARMDKSIQDGGSMNESPASGGHFLTRGRLLSIIQGPVTPDGQIIIATTNMYDKIREMMPALVRPGRLTPINMDMWDDEHLDKFTQMRYNQPSPVCMGEGKKVTPSLCQVLSAGTSYEDFAQQLKHEISSDSSA